MTISIIVKPSSTKGPLIVSEPDGAYTIYLRAKPHDGEANTALITLLAQHFHVPKTSVTILRGTTSRRKLINLPG